MATKTATIIWTKIDEAPALATHPSFPSSTHLQREPALRFETRDISLAGRIIANFPDYLTEKQRIPDYLAQLGELTLTPEANIIKLPNVSASIPQLMAAIKELRAHGYNLPDYPEEPKTDAEKELQARYAKCLGERREPGAAARELGSQGAAFGKTVFKEASAQNGRMGQGFEIPCRPYDRRGFLRQREVRHREETDDACGSSSSPPTEKRPS